MKCNLVSATDRSALNLEKDGLGGQKAVAPLFKAAPFLHEPAQNMWGLSDDQSPNPLVSSFFKNKTGCRGVKTHLVKGTTGVLEQPRPDINHAA